MCGIVGFFGMGFDDDSTAIRLEVMLRTIAYRGPDDLAIYWDGYAGLGTARLSIIDAKNGQQPMTDESRRYWLCFNGEIFNYIELRETLQSLGQNFKTQSDTEVLLKSLIIWGKDALPLLNGQFAFVFYDRLTKTAILARDRFGERPLHIWKSGSKLAFGSEIKTLFSIPEINRKFDVENLRQSCHFWTTLPDRTVFENINTIPPGYYGVWSSNKLTLSQYFHPPNRISRITDPRDASEKTISILTDAVKIRMRSDVDIGVYLSGGIDSAIIGVLANSLMSKPLKSFSVEFSGVGFDESKYQQIAAKYLGTSHEAITVSSDDIRSNFPDVIRHCEAPLFRTAPVPMYLLSKQVKSKNIKVVLTGEGADEIFYGYDIYKEANFLANYNKYTSDQARISSLAKLYPYLEHFSGRYAQSILPVYRTIHEHQDALFLSHKARFSNGSTVSKLIKDSYDFGMGEKLFYDGLCKIYPNFSALSTMQQVQSIELYTLLHGYLLASQGDRMSSAHSIEGRCPFLDPNVCNLASELSDNLLLKNGLIEKYILKLAFGKKLPKEIINRPKQPYRSPGSECLRLNKKSDWVSEILSRERIKQSEVLNHTYANKLVDLVNSTSPNQISPKFDHSYITLISILLLENQFIFSTPKSDKKYKVRRITF